MGAGRIGRNHQTQTGWLGAGVSRSCWSAVAAQVRDRHVKASASRGATELSLEVANHVRDCADQTWVGQVRCVQGLILLETGPLRVKIPVYGAAGY